MSLNSKKGDWTLTREMEEMTGEGLEFNGDFQPL